MRRDGAAHLDDMIRALRQEDVRWTDLDASTVEEVVRRSLHDGCPRFEFLQDAQGQRMIRATGKHTFNRSFNRSDSERQPFKVSFALVQYCRRVREGAWVPEAELVDVAQAQVDESFDQPAVLAILRSERHNYDDRLRFEEWTDGSAR